MIAAITIENFKSISSPIEIKLQHLNLLFGPNGAGKSVIADALAFARRCLLRKTLEDIEPETFRECVHGHEYTQPIRLSFSFSFGDIYFGNFPANPEEGFADDFDELLGIIGDGTFASVRLVVRLEDERVFVTEVEVVIDGIRIATVTATSSRGPVQARLNYGHPILDTRQEFSREPDWRPEDEEWESPLYERRYALFGSGNLLTLDLDDALPLREFDVQEEETVKTIHPSLPHNALLNFKAVVRYLIGQPVLRLRMELQQLRFLAVDRACAQRPGHQQSSFDLNRCCESLNADQKLRDAASRRMADRNGLAIPITVEQREGWHINGRRRAQQTPDWSGFDVSWVARQRQKRVVFVDERNQTELQSQELSLGTATVLPIVVACLDEHNVIKSPVPAGMIVIEEPEAHLHPTAAAALGDLFVDVSLRSTKWYRKQIIAETHSEHLTLRVLRRLREQSREQSPQFTEADISIIYFSKEKYFGKPFRLEIDKDSTLLQPWPDDFFQQDDMDRFA